MDNFWGDSDEPQSLKDIITLAKSMGLDMVHCFIPDGLGSYEEKHRTKAVIFDVRSEDVIMIEKDIQSEKD
jgi:hypothetical protein